MPGSSSSSSRQATRYHHWRLNVRALSAAFLRQIGWDADVYERSNVELVSRGARITGHPELIETLEASGAGTRDLGVEVPKRVAIDREGRVT